MHLASRAPADGPDLTGRLWPLPVDTYEPTLGADDAGGIWFVGHWGGVTGSGVMAMRSDDGGANWTMTGPFEPSGSPALPTSLDPFLHVDDATGRVFLVGLQGPCAIAFFTDDRGTTWVPVPAFCGQPPGPLQDHPSIATGIPRTLPTVLYPNVVYWCVNRVADSACASSVDGGLTFGPLVTVFTVDQGLEGGDDIAGLPGGLIGHVETDADGRVLLPKRHYGHPQVAISEDDGQTWRHSLVNESLGVRGHEVRVAADDAGTLYVFWPDHQGRGRLAISTDHGMSWGPAHDITPPGVTSVNLPAPAGGAAGQLALAFIGATNPGGHDADPGNQVWHAFIAAVVAGDTRDPVVAFARLSADDQPVHRGVCLARCGDLGDFIDADVGRDGRVWASFAQLCAEGCTDNGGRGYGVLGSLDPAIRLR